MKSSFVALNWIVAMCLIATCIQCAQSEARAENSSKWIRTDLNETQTDCGDISFEDGRWLQKQIGTQVSLRGHITTPSKAQFAISVDDKPDAQIAIEPVAIPKTGEVTTIISLTHYREHPGGVRTTVREIGGVCFSGPHSKVRENKINALSRLFDRGDSVTVTGTLCHWTVLVFMISK
jgi:hypothetical protein